MTPAPRKKYLKRLEELASELSAKGPHKISPNRQSDEKVGGDEDEQPLNEMLQAIASKRNKEADGVLLRVHKALKKLRESPDEFGECEECGEEIASGRLEAMPWAELCIGCQNKRDPARGGTRKKLTDYT